MQAPSNDAESKEEVAESMIPIGHAFGEQRLDPVGPAGQVVAGALPDMQPDAGEPGLRGNGEQLTLTKAELAELLFERVGLNKREAKDMVETFFDEIRAALERGESVKLSGFGNFQLRDKPQRPGRNPKTGEEIPISARRVVTFHASQKLKSQIEGIED